MTIAPPSQIGTDIAKDWLDHYDATTRQAQRITNDEANITLFVNALPPHSSVTFEATAPYDTVLRRCLSAARVTAFRVNPGQARDFAKSRRFLAKSDQIDARVLALMAQDIPLTPEPPFDEDRERLAAMHRRRDQLVSVRAVERGRIADAPDAFERNSLARHIAWLDAEIAALDADIKAALKRPAFAPTVALLRSAQGVGEVTAATLIALLPELGKRSAKTIAALAGLAPFNCDSGKFRGQRRIQGGRRRVRQALYMAAITAIRWVPRFKAAYLAIKQRSGHAKVGIIAVARKLLIALNSMLKTGQPFRADMV
jgi:transposase